MKTNGVYKRAYNQCLSLLSSQKPGDVLASEPQLSRQLNVSRTTVRAVIAGLIRNGLVKQGERERRLLRLPLRTDYLDSAELEPLADMLELKFMAWMVGPDCQPGGVINGLDLARQFGVSTSAIRECLNKFSHYGLLERQSNGRWRALGLTVEFVEELFDMREVMEYRAVDRFVALPPGHPAWEALTRMEEQHRALLADFDRRYREFSELDHRFHKLVNGVSPNRFFSNIQGVMSAIFHYHYQWNKKLEKERNHVAVREHLAYIEGLKSGDLEKARAASRLHLETARTTMMASIEIAP